MLVRHGGQRSPAPAPELFGETVTLVSLMMAWPGWLFVASVVLVIVTFVLFLAGMAIETTRGFQTDAGLATIGNACGSIALLLILAYGLDNPLTRKAERIEWIRTIAYHVDFHPIPRFPGAPTDARAKVLENGWLAIAVERNGQIEFDIVPARASEQPDGQLARTRQRTTERPGASAH